MFIDRVILDCKSGKGGDGKISFLHEKNRPNGGPDGGNGGRGGSIYLKASNTTTSLVNYRHAKTFIANDGDNGDIKNLYGRSAKDLIIELPVGSVVFLEENHQFICDLNEEGKTFLLCKGGRGGRGNACFKTSRNKAPKIAENGLPGQRKRIVVELKLLADVGIIGYPNAGKSTFISTVTNAKAKISDYPFTTIIPNLGVVNFKDNSSFVLADMPGLIDGASLGKGLGINFLKHIERTKVLIHMVDMSSSNNPILSYHKIREELEKYGMHLVDRPEIIVGSKVDDDDAKENFKKFNNSLKKEGKEAIAISSLLNFNLDKVLYRCEELLKDAITYPIYEEKDFEVTYDLSNEKIFDIEKINDHTFKITGERVLRTYKLINISEEEGLLKLIKYLDKIGVEEKLEELNAKSGDIVIIDDFEFVYYE